MAANEYILDLIRDLVDNQVNFIVCGGVAVVLQGVERMTMDLDLSVDMTEENLKKFLCVIEKNKMSPRAPIPAESILDPDIVNTIVQQKRATVFTFIDTANPFRQIDIFITKENSYETIINSTDAVMLDNNYKIRIVSIDKLIEMKKGIKPIRDKDLYDIMRLNEIKETIHEK
ncbi:hypothetical protein KKA14_01485 [bacterium]|nr:hypothetical protein [bacterium]